MSRHIIITTCTKNKSTEHMPEAKQIVPSDYLPHPASVSVLESTREEVLAMPGSAYNPAYSQHYAFDLYVREPKTQLYEKLREEGRDRRILARLLHGGLIGGELATEDNSVDWFFLTAGYGLLHVLELARPYQASFTRTIAKKNGIPDTKTIWKRVLPGLLDVVFATAPVTSVHVFGSSEYVAMVQETWLYKTSPKLFEVHQGRANKPSLRSDLSATVLRLYGV